MIGVLILIYMTFFGIGMGDPLLGSAWPSMYSELGVDVSFAGVLAMFLTGSTTVAAFLSARMLNRFGAKLVLPFGLLMISMAVLGFSLANHFIVLCLLAMMLGFGLGNVDAGGNTFLAMHYSAKYINWLHCLWAVGATITPNIMAFGLTQFDSWRVGYRITGFAQMIMVAILLFSIPLWKRALAEKESQKKTYPKEQSTDDTEETEKVPGINKLLRLPGAPLGMLSFFFMGGLGAVIGLWSNTYLVIARNIPREVATSWFALYFLGIVITRLFAGFLTMRFHSRKLVYAGFCILAIGLITIALPFSWSIQPGLVLAGIGIAPLFPNFIHNTPGIFGNKYTPAMISLQFTAGFCGIFLGPALFGQLGRVFGFNLFPFFVGFILVCLIITTIILYKRHPDKRDEVVTV
jgi:MFS family permease